MARSLGELFAAELQQAAGCTVVGPGAIAAPLAKRLRGCAGDAICLAEAAAALEVDQVAHGQVAKKGKAFVVTLRLVNARRGREVAAYSEAVGIKLDEVSAAVKRGAPQMWAQAEAAAPLPVVERPAPRLPPQPPPLPAPPEEEGTGSIAIRSVPSGAVITVDGAPAGSTPAALSGLPARTYEVAVVLTGYARAEAAVEVKPNAAAEVT